LSWQGVLEEEAMYGSIKRIDARALKAALHDGLEIALLDAREEQTFGERHVLMAACMPLGRIEVLADDMVPRRQTRVVWCDDGGGLGERAALRMADLGYSNVSILEGGIAAWESAGFRIYSGVHVPSKAFAEVVEHDLGTPWITATELKALIDAGRDIAVFDSRSFAEYHSNSIPTAVSVPGAELVYRFKDLVPSPSTTVIVNCGGRTRSIIGAQSLINAGVANKVVSLKDGTMAWHLAGFQVTQGADRRPPEVSPGSAEVARRSVESIASRLRIPRIDPATLAAWRAESDRRSLYVLDVRTPAEYEAGHVAGIRSAPGGQLVQETDNYLAAWGARVVLADTDGVRAVMTASWLKQMGWSDVAVIRLEDVPGSRVTGPHRPLALGLEHARVAAISPAELKRRLEAGTVCLIDLEYSKLYRNGHIPGAWFATRTRLGAALEKLPPSESIVLTSPDGDLAHIAAAELARTAVQPVHALEGGTRAWTLAGYPLAKEADRMAETPDDVWLPARERGGDRESAMRAYLAWEIDLVNQMATDDDQRFMVVKV
jgi:rhodanese-related sulfurtransferase